MGTLPSHTYDGREIKLKWKTDFVLGEERTFTLKYHVQRPIAGLYFGAGTPDLKDRKQWMSTDHETTRARYWLACVDHPSCRTTFEIAIVHRSEHKAVAGVRFVSTDEHSDGYSKTVWRLDQPCPSYLFSIIVGHYTEVRFGEHKGKPIAAFAPEPIRPEVLNRSFGKTPELLELCTSLLGELPWDKYFQFATPGIGGAMENISLVSWDESLLLMR